MRRLLMLSFVAVALLAALIVPAPTRAVRADGPSLLGGGSSFAALEIDAWRSEVARAPFGLKITYNAQGSSFGRQQYIAGTLDFAASDIPFTDPELGQLNGKARANFAYVPVSAGGLGLMFNLKDATGAKVNNLNLTRRAACRMFTEADMYWDDAEIASANPGLRLPHEYVRPVVRSDGSGTSYVFSEFCITVAPDVWQAFIASRQADTGLDPLFYQGKPVSNWPTGWGKVNAALNAYGVAAAVADSSTGLYTVTYNEAGYAKISNPPYPNASVQNAAGAFTQPTEDAVSIALGYATARGNGTFILDFTGGDPAAYFPSTYSYVIAQTTGFDPAKGTVLAKFLCYAVTKGQRVELTREAGYARLSAPLVDIARDSISKIPGAPPWDQCKVDSAPPPPAPTTTAPPAGGATTTTMSAVGGTNTTVVGGNGNSNGNGGVTATSISVDPVTGETVIVQLPTVDDTGQCIDPASGLPADPSLCASTGGQVPSGDGGSTGGGNVGAAPAIPNLPVDDATTGIKGTTIAWWLLQGATVCAVGAGLASLRRRGT